MSEDIQLPSASEPGRSQLAYPLDLESEGALQKALETVLPKMVARSKVQRDAYFSDDDGATVTFNVDQSAIHTITLGGNRVLAIRGGKVGQPFVLRLVQDNSGSRTVTWFSTIIWTGSAAPTLTATANKVDTFGFIITAINAVNGAANYDGYIIGTNVG